METEPGDIELALLSRQKDMRQYPRLIYEQEDYIVIQGKVYSAGMAVFLLSSIVFALRFLHNSSFVLFLAGLLQTMGGTFTLATADLDITSYFKTRKTHAVIFAILLIVGTVCQWIFGSNAIFTWTNVIILLPTMPFIYLMLRITPVLGTVSGYPTFVDLLVQYFVLTPLSFGIWVLLGGVPGGTAFKIILGLANIIGSFAIAIAYSWCQWHGDSASTASQVAMLVFLFVLGIVLILNQALDVTLNHQSAADNPMFLSSLAWCYAPLHLIFPPILLWMRPSVLGLVGRHWLSRRLQENRFTFIHVEKRRGSIEEVDEAIAAAADLDQCWQVPESSIDAYPLLVYASGNGHSDAVLKLLNADCDVNATSKRKRRGAAYTAAENGHADILQHLLEHGCDYESKDSAGRTPVYIASMNGHCECARLLVARGALVSEDTLLVAAAKGHRATVDMLVAAGDMRVQGGHEGGQRHITAEDAFEVYTQQQHQASHGIRFTVGFAVFLVSNAIFLYGELVDDLWINTRLDRYDWTNVVWGLLQPTGIVIMALADVDVNDFLSRNRVRLNFFLLLWCCFYIFLAFPVTSWLGCSVCTQGLMAIGYAAAIPPFVYLAWRYEKVVGMNDDFARLTDLFAQILALDLIGQAALWREPPIDYPPIIYQGVLGPVGTYFVYRWSQRNGESHSLSFKTSMCAYLFFTGSGSLLGCAWDLLYHGLNLGFGAWFLGIVHLVPTITFFAFRRSVHRKLGKKWLGRRIVSFAKHGTNSAQIAKDRGDLAEVESVLSRRGEQGGSAGGFMNGEWEEGYTLLTLAAFNNHVDAVKRLLHHYRQFAATSFSIEVNAASRINGWTPIYAAALRGNTDIVALLIGNGADVNKAIDDGTTPLLMATSFGHKDIVSHLLEAGGKPSHQWMGLDPIDVAPSEHVLRRFRAYQSHFTGAVLPHDGCTCVASWPGIYARLWDELIEKGRASELSTAVVFLPQHTLHYGKCGTDKCYCIEVRMVRGRSLESAFVFISTLTQFDMCAVPADVRREARVGM
jgi:ankyrin repeat protein